MRKWATIIIIIAALLLLSAYIFLPKKINSTTSEKISCNENSLDRFVMAEGKWPKWWPGSVLHDSITNKNIYAFNGYNYIITARKYNSILVQISQPDLIVDGAIFFLQVKDSIQAEWKYSLETNSNPINKLNLYRVTKNLDSNLREILNSMKAFLESNLKVYGMNIDEVLVKDTILVSTKFSSKEYPGTPEIYKVIDSIKNYISLHKAIETNPPMLNIWQDSGLYKTTIAIPVNKEIPENKVFSMKRMVPGNILVSEVKGGGYTSTEGLRQMGLYVTDNNFSSPAIPFESLVTNRMQEPDTSKWITKIYYPVF
ncbi:MAG TPA: hypothetical protein VIJ92_03625 [Ginsengibacter sp.]